MSKAHMYILTMKVHGARGKRAISGECPFEITCTSGITHAHVTYFLQLFLSLFGGC